MVESLILEPKIVSSARSVDIKHRQQAGDVDGPPRARRSTSFSSRGVETVRFATTRIRVGGEEFT
jgi:hypothetical protein